jgi:hypothetical protein
MTTSAENLEKARRAGAIQIIETVTDGYGFEDELEDIIRTLLDRLKL